MMRPWRLRIMPLRQARARRKVAVQVYGEDMIPLLVFHAHEQIVFGDAGIADENVETAHRSLGRRDERLDRRLVGKIAGKHVNVGRKLSRERPQRIATGAGQGDGSRPAHVRRARSPDQGRRLRP